MKYVPFRLLEQTHAMAVVLAVALTVALVGAGCTDDVAEEGAFADHPESADLVPVAGSAGKSDDIGTAFDRNRIVGDAFYQDADAMSAAQIQRFFEETPYGERSWLADETVGGELVSRVIADVSTSRRVHPVMILSRMQVEQGLISRTSRPSQFKVDRALGCGCFDGQSCQRRFLGLGKQIDCAAETLRGRFDDSVSGGGEWVAGVRGRSLDGLRVTPANHATAALYAYTPWVLEGRGGNWLVWNITKKFVLASDGIGEVGDPPWVGSPCVEQAECDFLASGEPAFCFTSDAGTNGFCTIACEGFCPDKSGRAGTFCIDSGVDELGVCASVPADSNEFCAAIPGTSPLERDRYIGASGAPATSQEVCAFQ